jgi:hypothetical protein
MVNFFKINLSKSDLWILSKSNEFRLYFIKRNLLFNQFERLVSALFKLSVIYLGYYWNNISQRAESFGFFSRKVDVGPTAMALFL